MPFQQVTVVFVGGPELVAVEPEPDELIGGVLVVPPSPPGQVGMAPPAVLGARPEQWGEPPPPHCADGVAAGEHVIIWHVPSAVTVEPDGQGGSQPLGEATAAAIGPGATRATGGQVGVGVGGPCPSQPPPAPGVVPAGQVFPPHVPSGAAVPPDGQTFPPPVPPGLSDTVPPEPPDPLGWAGTEPPGLVGPLDPPDTEPPPVKPPGRADGEAPELPPGEPVEPEEAPTDGPAEPAELPERAGDGLTEARGDGLAEPVAAALGDGELTRPDATPELVIMSNATRNTAATSPRSGRVTNRLVT